MLAEKELKKKIRSKMSETDFLDFELANESSRISYKRFEFLNGEIRELGYATDAHEKILNNFIFLFNRHYWDSELSIYPSNRLIFIEQCNKYFYPDSLAVLGQPLFKTFKKTMNATVNPALIVEISSNSTEEYDRLEKWECYQTIPSLNQYVMISQKEMKVESYRRIEDEWHYVSIDGFKSIVKIMDCIIQLEDLYKKVIF